MPRVVVDSKSIYSQSVTSRVSSPKSIHIKVLLLVH